MTLAPLEHRLRQRIDTLTGQRDKARVALARDLRHRTGHCELCGGPAKGRLCHAHKDLA